MLIRIEIRESKPSMARTLGMIGGIGPESTVDYYKSLIAGHGERSPNRLPSIIINSIDMKRILALLNANQLSDIVEFLLPEIDRLAKAGADFGLLSANTPHIVFDDLAPRSPIPLLSIVEATREEAQRLGFERVGLLGTRFTMQARFYPDVFARSQIRVFTPIESDQAYIHDKYFSELVPGIFKPETRKAMTQIIARMRERDGIQAVILGGTELPLLLRDSDPGLLLLDTTQIHVKAALEQML